MDYLHSLLPGETETKIKTTTGREFVLSQTFLQSLLDTQPSFQKYALVQFTSDGVDFAYSGDRARFRTSHGLFEFDRPTFSKLLKCFDTGKRTIFGPAEHCKTC